MSATAQIMSIAAIALDAGHPALRPVKIMKREQKTGAGSNRQTLSAVHDLFFAEPAPVAAETEFDRIEAKHAMGSIFEGYLISIADAKTGVVEASHP
ncbi:MAG: hypothetical protein WAM85_13840 [Terracidiphilus sp.]